MCAACYLLPGVWGHQLFTQRMIHSLATAGATSYSNQKRFVEDGGGGAWSMFRVRNRITKSIFFFNECLCFWFVFCRQVHSKLPLSPFPPSPLFFPFPNTCQVLHFNILFCIALCRSSSKMVIEELLALATFCKISKEWRGNMSRLSLTFALRVRMWKNNCWRLYHWFFFNFCMLLFHGV